MERIIVNRLTWYIDKHHLLNDNQAVFRSCRSTIDQLLRLHTDANQGLKCKKTTLAVFIDFSKAFDLLWREGLLYKLRKKGITGNTFAWIADFMSKRTMQVRVGATLSTVKEVEMGTPQGSVLSPLLFLLMVSDFPETVGIKPHYLRMMEQYGRQAEKSTCFTQQYKNNLKTSLNGVICGDS